MVRLVCLCAVLFVVECSPFCVRRRWPPPLPHAAPRYTEKEISNRTRHTPTNHTAHWYVSYRNDRTWRKYTGVVRTHRSLVCVVCLCVWLLACLCCGCCAVPVLLSPLAFGVRLATATGTALGQPNDANGTDTETKQNKHRENDPRHMEQESEARRKTGARKGGIGIEFFVGFLWFFFLSFHVCHKYPV